MKSHTCFGCLQSFQADHKCTAVICQGCRLGKVICCCRGSQQNRPGSNAQTDRSGNTGQASKPAAPPGQGAGRGQGQTAKAAPGSGFLPPPTQSKNNMGGAAALAFNVESNSVLLRDTQKEVVTLGSSLVPREVIHMSGEKVPILYDTGSSESIIDCSLKHLCSNVHEKEVSLTTVNASELKKVEVGEVELVVDEGTPVKVEVIILELQKMQYNLKQIELPETWISQYDLPPSFSVGGTSDPTLLILGAGFFSRYGPLQVDSYEGLNLSVSRITNSYLISGYYKGSDFKDISNFRVNFGGLSKMDRDFLQSNILPKLDTDSGK